MIALLLEFIRRLIRRRRFGLAMLLLMVMLNGCAPHGGRRDEPQPEPEPQPVSIIENAAAKAISDFREALADEAEKTAGKAAGGELKEWQPAFDDWSKRNISRRDKVFSAFARTLETELVGRDDKGELKQDVPFDAEKLSETARAASKGFAGK